LSEDIVVNHWLVIPGEEIHFRASRSSGPGGQHVNTSATRVELRWDIRRSKSLTADQRDLLEKTLAGRINRRGELVLSCETHRSQRQNRLAVQARLVELVRRVFQPRKRRLPTSPPPAAHERRLRQKRRRAERKRLRQRPYPKD
jgi:ribosome-associated protein